MYRVKQLLGASLTLRNYNAQVGETYVMIKALNKLTGIGMPKAQYFVVTPKPPPLAVLIVPKGGCPKTCLY